MSTKGIYPLLTWCTWVLVIPVGIVVLTGALVALTELANVPFDSPDLVWLLGAVPLAGLLFVYGITKRRRALTRFTSVELGPLLAAGVSPRRQAGRAGLLVLAVASLVAGVLGPRWGHYLHKQKVRGVDIVIALDVSRSMLANDVLPNRFDRAKQEIRQQILERPQFAEAHRLALLAFAGSTSLKVPLTTDRLTFRSKLDALNVGSAPRGGTAVGKAIQAAADLFVKSPQEATKLILVFTDGEDHEGDPEATAKAALQDGNIRVYTIGVGDPARSMGAQVPGLEAGKGLVYEGQLVFSKVQAESLKRVAEAGGGRYASVEDLYALVSTIAGMKRAELSTEERMRHRPQYQWFVALALFCLGLETTLRERGAQGTDVLRRSWQTQ